MSAKGDASYFLSLTNEVIDIIFSYNIIDYKDLCRCSQVCTKFYAVATSHQLWRKKALRRWDSWLQLQCCLCWGCDVKLMQSLWRLFKLSEGNPNGSDSGFRFWRLTENYLVWGIAFWPQINFVLISEPTNEKLLVRTYLRIEIKFRPKCPGKGNSCFEQLS